MNESRLHTEPSLPHPRHDPPRATTLEDAPSFSPSPSRHCFHCLVGGVLLVGDELDVGVGRLRRLLGIEAHV